MKTKSVLLMWGLLMPFVAMAQYDDDDLYFVPSKKQTRQVSVITTTVPSETTVTTYVPSSYSGSTRDVDEYNRRGRYRRSAAGDGSEASGVDSLATAYTAGYAQGYGDAYSRGYTDAAYDIPSYRVRFFNCYDPFWYDSWLWSPYWYDPWYYSGWSYSWGWGWSYYRPWYYGPGWYGGYSYGWGRPYYSWRSPYYYGGRYDYWRRPGEGRPLYNGRTYSGNRHSNVVTGRYTGHGNRYNYGGVMGRTGARSTNPSYGRMGGGRSYNNGRSCNNGGGRSYNNGRSYGGGGTFNGGGRPSGGSSRPSGGGGSSYRPSLGSGMMGGGSRGGGFGGGGRSMGGGGGRSMGRGR